MLNSVCGPTDRERHFNQAACSIFCTQLKDTHAVVDKVGDVALVSCIHCVHILHIVQVKQVCGALAVVHVTPPLCFICCDDL